MDAEQELKIPEKRTQFDPFSILTPTLDAEQQAVIESWLNEPMIEYNCELDRTKMQSVDYWDKLTGKHTRALIFDYSPQVNGVRWNLQPGKNKIPKSLYEAMMDTVDIAKSMQPRALSGDYKGQELTQLSRY